MPCCQRHSLIPYATCAAVREDTLAELDRLAGESNYSRNELINIILSHGVKNIEIE